MASVSNSRTFEVNGITFKDQSGLDIVVTQPPEKRTEMGYKIKSVGAHVFIKNIILKTYNNIFYDFYEAKNVTIVQKNDDELEFTETTDKVTYTFFVKLKAIKKHLGDEYFYVYNKHITPGEAIARGGEAESKESIRSYTKIDGKLSVETANIAFNEQNGSPARGWGLFNQEGVIFAFKDGRKQLFWFHPIKAPDGKILECTVEKAATLFTCADPKIKVDLSGFEPTTNGEKAIII